MRISDWISDVCSSDLVEHREGGDPSASRKSPGRTKYEPITLERGVTHDIDFEQWANKIWNFGAGAGSEASLADFRKDLILDVFNEAGQKVLAYQLYRCWVSEYQALPDLDANANARSEEHTSELQSLMRISYAVFCLNNKLNNHLQ